MWRPKPIHRFRAVVVAVPLLALGLPFAFLQPKTFLGHVEASTALLVLLTLCLLLAYYGWSGELPVELYGAKWRNAANTVDEQTAAQQAELEAVRTRVDALGITAQEISALSRQMTALNDRVEALEEQVDQLLDFVTTSSD